MPRIDFYILPEHNIPQRFVCNLTSKVKAEGYSVHIQAQDKNEAKKLDDSLWTFRDISFLPHALIDDADVEQHTVTIGWPDMDQNKTDVLINLTQNEPVETEDYTRILEIVSAEANSKQRARELYRSYREKGYELNTHNIDSSHG